MRKKEDISRVLKLTLMIVAILIVIMGILLVFQKQVGSIANAFDEELTSFERYYVLIAEESDSILWESVYEGAIEAGVTEADAYVEFIENGDGREYTLQEKLRIAIDSNVDGIIISSDSLEETTELINEAIEKEIAVVTVLSDATDSFRHSYVGVNNYTLGETYGELVWEYLSEMSDLGEASDCTISILMDASNADTGKNTTYLGLKDYLDTMIAVNDWPYQIVIEAVAMNREETFVAEETIGNIIVAGNSDIMICLNAEDTETAYRTIVDYNLVGSMEILGYYESEVILEAIEKDIIHATVTVDGSEVGSQSVRALYEYEETGYVNGYFPVDIQVLDGSNVTEYLEKYTEVSEGEDE